MIAIDGLKAKIKLQTVVGTISSTVSGDILNKGLYFSALKIVEWSCRNDLAVKSTYAFTKDQGLVPSTHLEVHNHLEL